MGIVLAWRVEIAQATVFHWTRKMSIRQEGILVADPRRFDVSFIFPLPSQVPSQCQQCRFKTQSAKQGLLY